MLSKLQLTNNHIKSILFVLIPFAVYALTQYLITNQEHALLITLVLATVIFWAASIIPEYQTALYFLFICLFFKLADNALIFSGFYSSAFWLVFSGMIMVIAMKQLKLNQKILSLFQFLNIDNYLKTLILVSLFTLVICFIIPSSMNRVIISIPILHAICANFGYEQGSKGYTGIMLMGIISNSLPGFVLLPANLPNMILAGLSENIYNYKILYSNYFISNFLIFGILKDVIAIALIYFFYQEPPKQHFNLQQQEQQKQQNKLVITILSIIVFLWLSDSIHGISPSMIAVFGALALLYPAFNIVQSKELSAISFPTLIFVAGLISLGNILADNQFIKQSLETLVAQYQFSDNGFINYMSITIFTSLSGIILTQPTIPPLFTPLAGQLSELTGFSLNDIFMMQAASFSNLFFMHQSPPVIIGMQLAFLSAKDMIKMLLLIAALTIIFLYPLHYLWLQFLAN